MGDLTFIPIEKLDRSKKYAIVGIQKCGTSSLYSFLVKKGFDVTDNKHENAPIPNFALHYDYKRIPIIITRNPIKRAFSDFRFFGRQNWRDATFLSDYIGICSMWCGIIYSLEYLKTFDDFPHWNQSGRDYDILTPEIELKIRKELRR